MNIMPTADRREGVGKYATRPVRSDWLKTLDQEDKDDHARTNASRRLQKKKPLQLKRRKLRDELRRCFVDMDETPDDSPILIAGEGARSTVNLSRTSLNPTRKYEGAFLNRYMKKKPGAKVTTVYNNLQGMWASVDANIDA